MKSLAQHKFVSTKRRCASSPRGDDARERDELAHAAGLARGTIYNNVENLDSLFEEVAAALGDEMHARILASFNATDDPALRPRARHALLRPSRP